MDRGDDPEVYCTFKKLQLHRKPRSCCCSNASCRSSNTSKTKSKCSSVSLVSTRERCCACLHAWNKYWREVLKLLVCLLACRSRCKTRVYESFCDVLKASKGVVCDVGTQLNRFLLYLVCRCCSK